MHHLREEQRVGLAYLATVTTLLQRVRAAHPTKGLYEAADMQWWWRKARPSDSLGQLFWFDDGGQPEAAVILTDWSDRVALDPMFLPHVTPDQVAHVIERGLAHANANGFEAVELEVSQQDDVLRDVLARHNFDLTQEGFIVEAWMDAEARPEVSDLHEGYRLTSRADTLDRPHHNGMSTPEMSERLQQTSLYRTDGDLLVVDADENPAAYGLFWHDPSTGTGLVEPMRTEENHQKRGLARHVLTAGLELLFHAGAERIKIVYEPDNPAAGHLYRSVGFEKVKQTDAFAGKTGAATGAARS